MSWSLPRAAVALLVLGGAAARQPAAVAQAFPTEYKNLRVLDKKIAPRDLKKRMEGIAQELGVKCGFCHNEDDYSSDELKRKQDARRMLQLVEHMRANRARYFKANVKDEEISCGGCHRGKSEPDPWLP